MSKEFSFGEEYLEYWQSTTQDNTKNRIPDLDVIEKVLSLLNIKEDDKVLDCGCSYGRLFPLIHKRSKNVYGIDVEMPILNEAIKFDYKGLNLGSAEESNLPNDYLDKVVMIGVFDVTEQEMALKEQNRILKVGGKMLITGKNSHYYDDDDDALIAERNAYLKNFPNHFTHTNQLIECLEHFGFKLEKILYFQRRGDFGQAEYALDKPDRYYEYCLILEKISEPAKKHISICDAHSVNAYDNMKANNYDDIQSYFNGG